MFSLFIVKLNYMLNGFNSILEKHGNASLATVNKEHENSVGLKHARLNELNVYI